MYSLGNELLIVTSVDGMKEFKSRTKDFIDYTLVTNEEFKNRLDKVTCILIDGDEQITSIVKEDRAANPDSRLIIPFSIAELQKGISEDELNNRFRDFLYEKDLFGIAVPLKSDLFFFGKDRSTIISELFAKYKQGEEGGLFGLRRIGKTSILYLLRARIAQSEGASVYFDCSSCHHYRWYDFLKYIIRKIYEEYSDENTSPGNVFMSTPIELDLSDDRYNEKNAIPSFENDLLNIYNTLGQKRILVIFDEIESIGYTTSPSQWWSKEQDALFFWQAIRSFIQMHDKILSFIIAGVNPMCIELETINGFDNPIFGMLSPRYISLFEYDDVKNMVNSIGGRLGIHFSEEVLSRLMSDYGGHPFLIRQVCSKINLDLTEHHTPRPATITKNGYDLKQDDYKQDMTSVIEQILGVIKNYYPGEFSLLKKLALDGRNAFKKELALGDKGIRHLVGYCLIEKEDDEFFIRIKSIEDYLKKTFIYDSTLDSQRDIRARINMRRDDIESKLRDLISFNLQSKYGKKSKEQLIDLLKGTTTDKNQSVRMVNAPSLKKAIEEMYLSQIQGIMEKDWKNYQSIFPDKPKFQAYIEILNRSRSVGAHAKSISKDDEVMFNVAFEYFENMLEEF